MVGKCAYSRGVIHSLTSTAKMVGLPSILRMKFRRFIRCYGRVLIQQNQMKNIGKTTTLNLREVFSQILFHQYRMTAYNKFMKQFKGGNLTIKKEDYLSLREVSTIVHDPPKTMDVKSP